MNPIAIGWTNNGSLRVDDIVEEKTVLLVDFHELVNTSRFDRLQFLYEIVQMALNTPELSEENKRQLKFNFNKDVN